jgi:PhnB protein
MKVKELFAYLTVDDAERAIAFYGDVFGAVPRLRLDEPGSSRIGHAELELGGTTLMLADEFPEYGLRSPNAIGGTSVTLHLHVDNADEVIGRAVEAGATVEMEPTDHFHGERSGAIRDPFGHRWTIGHTIEEVTPEDMQRRYDTEGEN